jgi:hypothetical protein
VNINEQGTLSNSEAVLIFGHPLKDIQVGARAPFAGSEYEVVNVSDAGVQLRRVAFDDLRQEDTPTSGTDERFHELDYFQMSPTDRSRSDPRTPVRDLPALGPLDPKQLAPGTLPGGEQREKSEVLGPELKMPRVPPMPNTPFTDPNADRYRWSSVDNRLQSDIMNLQHLLEGLRSLARFRMEMGDFGSLRNDIAATVKAINASTRGMIGFVDQVAGPVRNAK